MLARVNQLMTRSAPDSASTAVARRSPEFVARGASDVETVRTNNVGFTYPAEDVREDDMFLALVTVNDRGGTPDVGDTATGWTKLAEVKHNELVLAAFYQRAAGTETGAVEPFDWDAAGDTNAVALCQVYQYRYVDWENGGPFVGTPVSVTGDLTSLSMPTVLTQGENGLAVAALAFSDNVSEPDPTVTATGGTWIAPRDHDNTTNADDAAVKVMQAPLEAAGTIAGGTLSITPTAPQSSRSIAIGFALRGQVDAGDTTTLETSIAASADDARESTGTTAVNINSTTLFLAGNIVGLRFTGLAALAGRTIVQANIQLTSSGTEGAVNNGVFLIRGEAADTAAQYQAVNGNISGRTLTSAARNWTVPGWGTGTRTIRERSVDVRDIVQEITDRPGFGGVVAFVISSVISSRQWAAQDHATLQEATLTVRYLS